jgi:hypothetical protein
MDDARIRELAQEVLAKLRESPAYEVADLETRVARLEAAVRRLEAAQLATEPPATSTTVVVAQTTSAPVHPSLQLIAPKTAGDACCLEPDKPCVGSGQCRTYGY